MTRTKKLDLYLAVPLPGDYETAAFRDRAWDMLRYDRCYPFTEGSPQGWVVFKQPYREGAPGRWTLDRWRSFGFQRFQMATAPVGEPPTFPNGFEEVR